MFKCRICPFCDPIRFTIRNILINVKKSSSHEPLVLFCLTVSRIIRFSWISYVINKHEIGSLKKLVHYADHQHWYILVFIFTKNSNRHFYWLNRNVIQLLWLVIQVIYLTFIQQTPTMLFNQYSKRL